MPYHETLNPFSNRTAWDLGETSYAAAIREARASAQHLDDLTLSNPTRCGFLYDTEAILAPLANPAALTYDPNPIGILSAREAVARYYADHGAHIDPAQILLTTSTSESYSFLFRLLCDPADEVLVAQPSYPLFDFLADLDDVVLKPYPLFYDHGWSIDLDALERAITPRTRALLVVHPNNPTGHWTTPTERHHLQHLCARHNLALIVDEVFLDYPLTDFLTEPSSPQTPAQPATRNRQPATSFSTADHPALTFILSGLSKVAALPQMKVAWLLTLGPDPARTAALARLEVIADTFLSMNAPAQLALPSWLATRLDLQSQIRARTRENLATLTRLAAEHPGRLQLLRAEAGWSAVLNLPACVGEPACAERLVRERGVLLHPGSFYAMPEPTRLVASLIVATDSFASSMQRAIA